MTRKNFTDLTAIDCPLGELDDDTYDRLRAAYDAGGVLQGSSCLAGTWIDLEDPFWCIHVFYRLRPEPLTKPSINPDHVADWVRWIARDEGGDVVGYERKPEMHTDYWVADKGRYCSLDAVASLDPGTCHWRDSLVELRP